MGDVSREGVSGTMDSSGGVKSRSVVAYEDNLLDI